MSGLVLLAAAYPVAEHLLDEFKARPNECRYLVVTWSFWGLETVEKPLKNRWTPSIFLGVSWIPRAHVEMLIPWCLTVLFCFRYTSRWTSSDITCVKLFGTFWKHVVPKSCPPSEPSSASSASSYGILLYFVACFTALIVDCDATAQEYSCRISDPAIYSTSVRGLGAPSLLGGHGVTTGHRGRRSPTSNTPCLGLRSLGSLGSLGVEFSQQL